MTNEGVGESKDPTPKVLGLGRRRREQQLRFGNEQLRVQDWVRPSGQRCPEAAGHPVSQQGTSFTDTESSSRPGAAVDGHLPPSSGCLSTPSKLGPDPGALGGTGEGPVVTRS